MGKILHIDDTLAIEYGKKSKYPTTIYNKSTIKTISITDGEKTLVLEPSTQGELPGKHSHFTYKVVSTLGGTGNSYLDKLKGIK